MRVRVAAGTRNPAKLRGIESAYRRLGYAVTVTAAPVETSVGPQPIGVVAVVRGAVERAVGALRRVDADFGVGVEAGLVEAPGTMSGYVDVEACAVADPEGRVTLGFSPAFEFPPEAVRRVVSGEASEMEEEMVRLSGVEAIADKQGGIGFLTRGVVTREQLTEAAVLMAMVPRLRPQLYGDPPLAAEVLALLG